MKPSSQDAPKISVVVTTYRRADILRHVFDHILKQDLHARDFEVVVTDDGSPDDTPSLVELLSETAPFPVTYTRHENTGIGYTENQGIKVARAPIVLLIADDIFLTPGAVRAHLEFHEARQEPFVAVLGKVLQSPDLNQSEFLRKWDPFRFDELEDRDELPPYRFGAMNLSVKREFLLQHGLFLEHRGRGGAACMEDLELGYRLRPHGLRLFYTKSALAYHYHLTTLDTACQRWYERGLNYGEFRQYATDPELTVYFHVLNRETFREYAQVLRGPNSFRGVESVFAWHLVRHAGRVVLLNRFTARAFWRPLFDGAEKHRWIAALTTPKMYRAFLYYHFLRGVDDARHIYPRPAAALSQTRKATTG